MYFAMLALIHVAARFLILPDPILSVYFDPQSLTLSYGADSHWLRMGPH